MPLPPNCMECGSYSLDVNEFGKDEFGEYTDYICNECGGITRLSD